MQLVMFTTEYSLWVRKWKECISAVPETLMEALQEYSTFSYPNLNVLLHIALTLPLTSCESEQSFSWLKLIKTAQCASMMESWLSGLALMKVNRDRCNKLTSEDRFRELVKSFTQQYQQTHWVECIDSYTVYFYSFFLQYTCVYKLWSIPIYTVSSVQIGAGMGKQSSRPMAFFSSYNPPLS